MPCLNLAMIVLDLSNKVHSSATKERRRFSLRLFLFSARVLALLPHSLTPSPQTSPRRLDVAPSESARASLVRQTDCQSHPLPGVALAQGDPHERVERAGEGRLDKAEPGGGVQVGVVEDLGTVGREPGQQVVLRRISMKAISAIV